MHIDVTATFSKTATACSCGAPPLDMSMLNGGYTAPVAKAAAAVEDTGIGTTAVGVAGDKDSAAATATAAAAVESDAAAVAARPFHPIFITTVLYHYYMLAACWVGSTHTHKM